MERMVSRGKVSKIKDAKAPRKSQVASRVKIFYVPRNWKIISTWCFSATEMYAMQASRAAV